MDKYGIGEAFNPTWEKDWKEVISIDQHFDGDYLIRLMVHKLGLMIKHFKSWGMAEQSVIDTMDACYNLGLKILTFNYGDEADKIFDEKGSSDWLVESSEEDDYIEWNRLSDMAAEERTADTKRFFNMIGNNISTWWF